MFGNQNEDIQRSVDLLEVISQDEKLKLAYEARQKELSDQVTFAHEAKEEGRKEAEEEGRNRR